MSTGDPVLARVRAALSMLLWKIDPSGLPATLIRNKPHEGEPRGEAQRAPRVQGLARQPVAGRRPEVAAEERPERQKREEKSGLRVADAEVRDDGGQGRTE